MAGATECNDEPENRRPGGCQLSLTVAGGATLRLPLGRLRLGARFAGP